MVFGILRPEESVDSRSGRRWYSPRMATHHRRHGALHRRQSQTSARGRAAAAAYPANRKRLGLPTAEDRATAAVAEARNRGIATDQESYL